MLRIINAEEQSSNHEKSEINKHEVKQTVVNYQEIAEIIRDEVKKGGNNEQEITLLIDDVMEQRTRTNQKNNSDNFEHTEFTGVERKSDQDDIIFTEEQTTVTKQNIDLLNIEREQFLMSQKQDAVKEDKREQKILIEQNILKHIERVVDNGSNGTMYEEIRVLSSTINNLSLETISEGPIEQTVRNEKINEEKTVCRHRIKLICGDEKSQEVVKEEVELVKRITKPVLLDGVEKELKINTKIAQSKVPISEKEVEKTVINKDDIAIKRTTKNKQGMKQNNKEKIMKQNNKEKEVKNITPEILKQRKRKSRRKDTKKKQRSKNKKGVETTVEKKDRDEEQTTRKKQDIERNNLVGNSDKMVYGEVSEKTAVNAQSIKSSSEENLKRMENNEETKFFKGLETLNNKDFDVVDILSETKDNENIFETEEIEGVDILEEDANISIEAIEIRPDIFDIQHIETLEMNENVFLKMKRIKPINVFEEGKIENVEHKDGNTLVERTDMSSNVFDIEENEDQLSENSQKTVYLKTNEHCTDDLETENIHIFKINEDNTPLDEKNYSIRPDIFRTGKISNLDPKEENVDIFIARKDITPKVLKVEQIQDFEKSGDQATSKSAETTPGIAFIRAFESQDSGDHAANSQVAFRSIDDLQKARERDLTVLSQSIESSVAEMNSLKIGMGKIDRHLDSLEQDLIEQDHCCRAYRKQIDKLEITAISLASEITILENDRDALIHNSPYPHWLTIFDRSSQAIPHVGTEQDQAILDEMENCPRKTHLSRKELTLAMIDRLIDLRRVKAQTTLRLMQATQTQLTTLLGSRAATEHAYEGLLHTVGRIVRRLSKARRTFDIEVKKSRTEIKLMLDAMQCKKSS